MREPIEIELPLFYRNQTEPIIIDGDSIAFSRNSCARTDVLQNFLSKYGYATFIGRYMRAVAFTQLSLNHRSNLITAAAIIAETEITTNILIEAIISLRMFSYPLSYVLIYTIYDSVFKYYFPTVGHKYTYTLIKKWKRERFGQLIPIGRKAKESVIGAHAPRETR